MMISLIGYRGSGKSSVAQPLAERLEWDWIDADAEITRRSGRSIREIFDTGGEAEFRRIERELLRELLRRDKLVLASGGGAILNATTRAEMKAAGPVIWLTASAAVLAERIQRDTITGQQRPNLTSHGGLAEIRQMLEIRDPLYRECSTLMIDAEVNTVAEIVDRIVANVSEHRILANASEHSADRPGVERSS